jgi:transcriptional regulator with XRE-family HTH domain
MTLLQELREKSRLSLTDLGRARNLSVSALSQAERRKAVPPKRIRRELARFYREDETRLFDDEGLARPA